MITDKQATRALFDLTDPQSPDSSILILTTMLFRVADNRDENFLEGVRLMELVYKAGHQAGRVSLKEELCTDVVGDWVEVHKETLSEIIGEPLND